MGAGVNYIRGATYYSIHKQCRISHEHACVSGICLWVTLIELVVHLCISFTGIFAITFVAGET